MIYLRSDRLLIRQFVFADAAVFAASRSDPLVARFQSWDVPFDEVSATAMIGELTRADLMAPGWYQWAIEVGGELAGDIGIGTHQNRMQAEIGFTLARRFQGHGYAFEAVNLMLTHLFDDRLLHRVSAECDARNTASANLLDRLGFKREGLRRQHTWIKDEWTDDLLFGPLASDR